MGTDIKTIIKKHGPWGGGMAPLALPLATPLIETILNVT